MLGVTCTWIEAYKPLWLLQPFLPTNVYFHVLHYICNNLQKCNIDITNDCDNWKLILGISGGNKEPWNTNLADVLVE